jgi:hypothetical protein
MVRLWKGQNRQRASRREKFERLALTPPGQSDFGQQGGLAKIPNIGLWSWIAIRMNQQSPRLGSKGAIRLAKDASNAAAKKRCLETFDQSAVPHQVAQTGAMQVLGRNSDPASMATQRHFDGADRTAFNWKLRDTFNQSARSCRNRQRALG